MNKIQEAYCNYCKGFKTFYKLGEGFCTVDFGGQKVSCPECNGTGKASVNSKEVENGESSETRSTKRKKA